MRVPFTEFQKTICQLQNAAISISAIHGLLSEYNKFASHEHQWLLICFVTVLYQELECWRSVLREATAEPTKCTELVTGYPDFIGIADALTERVGGIAVVKKEGFNPTV